MLKMTSVALLLAMGGPGGGVLYAQQPATPANGAAVAAAAMVEAAGYLRLQNAIAADFSGLARKPSEREAWLAALASQVPQSARFTRSAVPAVVRFEKIEFTEQPDSAMAIISMKYPEPQPPGVAPSGREAVMRWELTFARIRGRWEVTAKRVLGQS